MSKNRQQRRTLRGPTVSVPAIVATDLVAVAPRPPVSAPEFPGVSDADTPVFDELMRDQPLEMTDLEAAALAGAPFESWGLDEIAPLPVETMIKELAAQLGEGTVWALEQEVGAEILNRRALNLGEEDGDEQPDDGPAGDALVADGPEGPAMVGGDGPDDHDPADQG